MRSSNFYSFSRIFLLLTRIADDASSFVQGGIGSRSCRNDGSVENETGLKVVVFGDGFLLRPSGAMNALVGSKEASEKKSNKIGRAKNKVGQKNDPRGVVR